MKRCKTKSISHEQKEGRGLRYRESKRHCPRRTGLLKTLLGSQSDRHTHTSTNREHGHRAHKKHKHSFTLTTDTATNIYRRYRICKAGIYILLDQWFLCVWECLCLKASVIWANMKTSNIYDTCLGHLLVEKKRKRDFNLITCNLKSAESPNLILWRVW